MTICPSPQNDRPAAVTPDLPTTIDAMERRVSPSPGKIAETLVPLHIEHSRTT
jgi:hypothetical protein